jgi:hypothetical protein
MTTLEHARDTRPLAVGDIVDGWEVVRVGTHTVGFFKNDWTANPQIPFVDPETSEMTPAWHEAMNDNH